jgi:hypothetical protein
MFVQIKQFPNYLVSSNGEIISLKFGRWKLRSQTLNSSGYPSITLYDEQNGKKTFKVHHLVCEAFLGPRPEGLVVNHKNGIKTDNRIENLEYCSVAENVHHADKMNLRWFREGEQHYRTKLSDEQILQILQYKGHRSSYKVALMFDIGSDYVRRLWNGEHRKSLTLQGGK